MRSTSYQLEFIEMEERKCESNESSALGICLGIPPPSQEDEMRQLDN